jgi:hypothetical protein
MSRLNASLAQFQTHILPGPAISASVAVVTLIAAVSAVAIRS